MSVKDRSRFLSVFGKKVFNILIYVLKIFNKYRFSLSRYSYFEIKFVNLQRENQTKLNVKLQNYEDYNHNLQESRD